MQQAISQRFRTTHGEKVRIEHWRTACSMLKPGTTYGKKVAYTSVPFFWTNQVDLYSVRRIRKRMRHIIIQVI
jgi:hypothetical protein